MKFLTSCLELFNKEDIMKLIYIEWEDSINSTEWMNLDKVLEWEKEDHNLVKQIGWLIKETKRHIVIASKMNEWLKYETDYGSLQKIPKTWIRKRIDLTKHLKKRG